FGDADVERLLADAGIVRNLAKIRATITNANAVIALRQEGGLVQLVWSFRPESTPAPSDTEPAITQSRESVALSKALKNRGFVFVGPTTMYALMEAIGMIDAHPVGSHRRGASGVWPG
ncbi:MAG: DNA-3-methyladenine glycosylase I, partial [Cryobacterium sp.]|nr:DNA-3-methyladenine glycosylase I [Cryobacterium sp.]